MTLLSDGGDTTADSTSLLSVLDVLISWLSPGDIVDLLCASKLDDLLGLRNLAG